MEKKNNTFYLSHIYVPVSNVMPCRGPYSQCYKGTVPAWDATTSLMFSIAYGFGGWIEWASDWWSGGHAFDLCRVQHILFLRLIKQYFQWSFSPFHWFQFLAKEYAQVLVNHLLSLSRKKVWLVNWPVWHDRTCVDWAVKLQSHQSQHALYFHV